MDQDTLVLAHVVFRHGDRTPDEAHVYPKDPHANLTYLPIGFGNLTNKGKDESYLLGRSLRARYDKFLGDVYYPGLIDPWSSSYDRTQVVLQLVLASLFPPKGEQVWNRHLSWQPIPFKFADFKTDRMFLGLLYWPEAVEANKQYVESSDGRAVIEKYQDVFSYLSEHTGLNIRTTRQVLYLAATLEAEKRLGLELPKWTDKLWRKTIEEIAQTEYVLLTANPRLTSYNVGLLIQKIVHDTISKIEGKSNCKMHIYSGHDGNVAMLLRCLNIFYPHMPKYCAQLILELHKIDGVYGFRIFYQESSSVELKLYTIPNCPSFCPLDKFIDVVQCVLDENKKVHQ